MDVNILIAEDEEDIRHLVTLHLTKEGYEVFEASNGAEALEIFTRERIDLLILDIMMPEMDGFALLQRIRKRSKVPVIMLTARTDEADKILGLGLGADDYVIKPFSVIELISRVNAHLRRYMEYNPMKAPEDKLRNGGIVMDLDDYSVEKDGVSIELNPKEFKMLRLFLENPGKIFTKKQIYESVWDEPYVGDNNTLMVHVSHLRDKIETDPKDPEYIKTIRGIGYRMDDKDDKAK